MRGKNAKGYEKLIEKPPLIDRKEFDDGRLTSHYGIVQSG